MGKAKFDAEKESSTFANRLRQLFDETKKTQRELVEYIEENGGKKYSIQMASNWTHGSEPPLSIIPIIADFFGVSVEYLLVENGIKSISADTKAVHQYLGISEKSINNIKNITQKKSLDILLESNELSDLIKLINSLKETLLIHRYYNNVKVFLSDEFIISFCQDEGIDFHTTQDSYIYNLFAASLCDVMEEHFNRHECEFHDYEFTEKAEFYQFRIMKIINSFMNSIKDNAQANDIALKEFDEEINKCLQSELTSLKNTIDPTSGWHTSDAEDIKNYQSQINEIEAFLSKFSERWNK